MSSPVTEKNKKQKYSFYTVLWSSQAWKHKRRGADLAAEVDQKGLGGAAPTLWYWQNHFGKEIGSIKTFHLTPVKARCHWDSGICGAGKRLYLHHSIAFYRNKLETSPGQMWSVLGCLSVCADGTCARLVSPPPKLFQWSEVSMAFPVFAGTSETTYSNVCSCSTQRQEN